MRGEESPVDGGVANRVQQDSYSSQIFEFFLKTLDKGIIKVYTIIKSIKIFCGDNMEFKNKFRDTVYKNKFKDIFEALKEFYRDNFDKFVNRVNLITLLVTEQGIELYFKGKNPMQIVKISTFRDFIKILLIEWDDLSLVIDGIEYELISELYAIWSKSNLFISEILEETND